MVEVPSQAKEADVPLYYSGPVTDFTPYSVPTEVGDAMKKRVNLLSGIDYREALEVFAVAFERRRG